MQEACRHSAAPCSDCFFLVGIPVCRYTVVGFDFLMLWQAADLSKIKLCTWTALYLAMDSHTYIHTYICTLQLAYIRMYASLFNEKTTPNMHQHSSFGAIGL